MKIELLYFDDCPNYPEARKGLEKALREHGVDDTIDVIRVKDEKHAQQLGFLGSPSIRINGIDIEPGREKDSAVFGCRLYPSNPKNRGLPPADMIARALVEAGGKTTTQGPLKSSEKPRLLGSTLAGALVAAALGSACCWGPGIFVALGLGAAGAGGFFESLRPYLAVLAVGLLGVALFSVYRRRTTEACCDVPSERKWLRRARISVWSFALLALGAFSYPHWGSFLGGGTDAWAGGSEFTISGMSCDGCADRICSLIKKVPGVKDARVDFKSNEAKILWDGEADDAQILKSVENAGFTAKRIHSGL